MAKVFAFWAAVSAGLVGVLAYELSGGRVAGASGHEAPPAAPAAAPTPPSHAELRERYRKRMEALNQHKDEGKTAESVTAPSEKDIADLHAVLKEREKKVAAREAEIAAKEKELKEKQVFLDEQVGKYEATLAKLRAEVAATKGDQEKSASSFRQVYESMDAKKAARILEDMDSETASKILAGLKQQKAAEILGKMDSKKALSITKRALSSVPK